MLIKPFLTHLRSSSVSRGFLRELCSDGFSSEWMKSSWELAFVIRTVNLVSVPYLTYGSTCLGCACTVTVSQVRTHTQAQSPRLVVQIVRKKMEASLRRKKCLPLVPALSCTGAPELWKPVSSTGEQHPCWPQETSVHSDNAGVQEEASSAAPLASDTIVVVCQF